MKRCESIYLGGGSFVVPAPCLSALGVQHRATMDEQEAN